MRWRGAGMSRTTTAARLHEHGSPLRVEEVALPEPGDGEVVVDLAFAGVNPVDRYTAAGQVASDGPLPRTLGGEASGRLDDGTGVLVNGGGLGTQRDGVWAQRAVVPREAVIALPQGVDLPTASAVGVAGLTAWNCVVREGEVAAGDRVLVLGAAGGVGLPIVGLAAARGATVWGQTGSPHKAQAIRDAGAADVIVTDADGLAAAAADLRPSVVIDPLGGPFTPAALALIQPRGRYVVFGTSAGREVTLNLQAVYRSHLRVLGYSGMVLSAEERAEQLRETLRAIAEGRLRIPVDRTLPLAKVAEALDLLAARALTGKVLLDLS